MGGIYVGWPLACVFGAGAGTASLVEGHVAQGLVLYAYGAVAGAFLVLGRRPERSYRLLT